MNEITISGRLFANDRAEISLSLQSLAEQLEKVGLIVIRMKEKPIIVEENKMIDFTQKVENYLDDFKDKEGCSFISEDVERMKWAITTIAEEVFGYDKLGKSLPQPPEKEIEELIHETRWDMDKQIVNKINELIRATNKLRADFERRKG